ncbi:hypothetical protein FGE05_26425 [Pseudomonas sp. ICMP22404]|nr:hypothetical protein FGE05_26425 [Pseudomonas sp. ICMP22404]
MGASLLAMAIVRSISMSTAPPPSRAGSLPQGRVAGKEGMCSAQRAQICDNRPLHKTDDPCVPDD